jgi:hypothetical protein
VSVFDFLSLHRLELTFSPELTGMVKEKADAVGGAVGGAIGEGIQEGIVDHSQS